MKKVLLSVSLVSLLFSCIKDKNTKNSNENEENEVITNVMFSFSDSAGVLASQSFNWINNSGFQAGGKASIDTIRLKNNQVYLGSVILLNTTTNPIDTISKEVFELRNEHQFFYTSDNGLNLNLASLDKDDNGVPLGLQIKAKTGNSSSGNLRIQLKHQPGLKPKSGNGDRSIGSTDLDVTFPVKVE